MGRGKRKRKPRQTDAPREVISTRPRAAGAAPLPIFKPNDGEAAVQGALIGVTAMLLPCPVLEAYRTADSVRTRPVRPARAICPACGKFPEVANATACPHAIPISSLYRLLMPPGKLHEEAHPEMFQVELPEGVERPD